MYTLSLEIVNKCNLNCQYCYLGEKKNTHMCVEDAKKAVDIGVHEANKQYDKTLVLYFIGGEPLLAYETIKEIVTYTKRKCKETGLCSIFSTTTNGTLLTNDITEFLSNNDFELKLSLDGPEYVHNLNRFDYAGKGSFNCIIDKLPLIKQYELRTGKNVSIAHVVTKNNYMYFKESFSFLLDLGFKHIETGIDHYCKWTGEEMSELGRIIEEVFRYYRDFMKRTKKAIFWNLPEQYLKAYLYPTCVYPCHAGVNNVFITTDGVIYTCLEMDEFKIGTAEQGLDVSRIREIANCNDKIVNACRDCSYINYCKTRTCFASNFELNKDYFQPVEISCFVTKYFFNLIPKYLDDKQLVCCIVDI